jgi:hypothetical protein
MEVKGYISQIKESNKKKDRLGPAAIQIFEIFSHYQKLTVYDINKIINPTKLKMSYKNVHEHVQNILKSGLIEQIQDSDKEHGKKYYKLTEYGLYLLFLNGPSILVDQNKLQNVNEPTISLTASIFQYYKDSLLFHVFLYPFIQKETIEKINSPFILIFILEYLTDCCRTVAYLLNDPHLMHDKYIRIFNWVNPTKQDIIRLLEGIRRKFKLQIDDYNKIKFKRINEKTLIISHPNFEVVIKLDLEGKKATVRLDKSKQEFEYIIQETQSDIILAIKIYQQSNIRDTFDNKRLGEKLVLNLLSFWGKFEKETNTSDFINILNDDKFAAMVYDTYGYIHNAYNIFMKVRDQNIAK